MAVLVAKVVQLNRPPRHGGAAADSDGLLMGIATSCIRASARPR